MKKVIKIFAFSLAALIAVTSIVWLAAYRPLTPLQVFWLAASAEDVVREDFAAAKNAARREPASMAFSIDDVDYELPLPDGATPFDDETLDNRTYILCQDALEPYFESLPSLGYAFLDQMGSMCFYRNEELSINLQILRRQYSHSFYIVTFHISEHAKFITD